MLLAIGATMRCRDGEAGRLKYVVIDPDDGEVTHLIVERGMLLRRAVVVPAAWVKSSSEQEIVLNATVAEVNELPEYREFDFIEPDPGYRPLSGHRVEEVRFWGSPYLNVVIDHRRPWTLRHIRLGVQEDEVLLQRGLPVQDRDGRTVGALDHLLVDPDSQRVTHLVVRRGGLWGTLWARQAHIVPRERVAAMTDDGVRLAMTREELDQAPLYQPPTSDTEITTELQRALETDPRTCEAGLRVEVQGGVVRFIGATTEAVRAAAHAIARRLRGVIGFADEVSPLPTPPLRIGAPVYALDGRYGTLAKVVVDPHARRVTHMMVHKGWLLGEDRVIPIERVLRADQEGIYLNAPAAELNQHPRYEEEAFVEPLPGWEELAPYAAADILFWGASYIGVAPPIIPGVEHMVRKGVPADEVVVRRGIDVFYADKRVATLDHVLLDSTSGEMTHLVVQQAGRGRRVIIPVEWMREITDEAIVLAEWQPDQSGVPTYEGTFDAAADATTHQKRRMRSQENDLDADSALFRQVLAELTTDPRTAAIPFEVVVDRGVVTLEGVVPSAAVKAAAEAITRRIPGVVTVISELEIRPPERELEPVVIVPPVRTG